jgi:tetratricopeptide (TPR) repeat protein
VIIGLGVLELRQDNYPRALTLLQISLALFRGLEDKRGIASALSHLGLLMHLQGDDTAAQSALEESVTLFKVLEDHWSVSNSLNNLGAIAQHRGHNDQALTLFEASLALQRAHCGDKQNLSYTLNALGWTAHAMGEEVRADALLTEALNLRRELGDKRGSRSRSISWVR